MNEIYFIAENGSSLGPYSKDELRNMGLSPDKMVWRKGLPAWVKLKDLPELADILIQESPVFETNGQGAERAEWFAIFNEQQMGPLTPSDLIRQGLEHHTPVWRDGMSDWQTAASIPELVVYLNRRNNPGAEQPYSPDYNIPPKYPDFSNNPQYDTHQGQYGNRPPHGHGHHGSQGYPYEGQNYGGNRPYEGQPPYGQPNQGYDNPYNRPQPPYGQNPYNPYNPYRQNLPTNWLPWAIGATIVGFLFSCIGAIFGIIGIIQANKANTFYATQDDFEGDRCNSNAKTMTIIGYCLAGLGLFAVFFTGIFN